MFFRLVTRLDELEEETAREEVLRRPDCLFEDREDRCFDVLNEYAPNFKSAVIDRQVLTVDIAATLAAYLGIKPPSGAVGNPLEEVVEN